MGMAESAVERRMGRKEATHLDSSFNRGARLAQNLRRAKERYLDFQAFRLKQSDGLIQIVETLGVRADVAVNDNFEGATLSRLRLGHRSIAGKQ